MDYSSFWILKIMDRENTLGKILPWRQVKAAIRSNGIRLHSTEIESYSFDSKNIRLSYLVLEPWGA